MAENTIVIEDSLPGVIAGLTAGCFTIAIPSDYTGQQDLTKANMMIKSFADLSVDDFFKMIEKSKLFS